MRGFGVVTLLAFTMAGDVGRDSGRDCAQMRSDRGPSKLNRVAVGIV